MRLPDAFTILKSRLCSAAICEASGLAALVTRFMGSVVGWRAVSIEGEGAGDTSSGARMAAITCPTGTSSPAAADMRASTPSAGASISTVALSVSISASGSPFATCSPSALSHCTILPVSCDIPNAGRMTSVAIIDLLPSSITSITRTCNHGSWTVTVGLYVQVRLGFARCGQRPASSVIAYACYQQFLRWKTGNHLAPVFRNDQLFLDARRRPAIGGGPESLERENHSLFNHLRVINRDQAAENGFLPDGKTYAVTVLEREGGLFIGEAKFFRSGPELDNVSGGHPRLDRVNGPIQDFPAILVSIYLRLRSASHYKGAIVAGAITVIAVQDVEICRVTRPQGAIGKHVWMGTATFARNSVDSFDMLRTQVIQNLADQANAFVFTYAGSQSAVQFIIGRVHHHACRGE